MKHQSRENHISPYFCVDFFNSIQFNSNTLFIPFGIYNFSSFRPLILDWKIIPFTDFSHKFSSLKKWDGSHFRSTHTSIIISELITSSIWLSTSCLTLAWVEYPRQILSLTLVTFLIGFLFCFNCRPFNLQPHMPGSHQVEMTKYYLPKSCVSVCWDPHVHSSVDKICEWLVSW